MINLIIFLNTHGVWLLVLFFIFYELYLKKNKESAIDIIFSVTFAIIVSFFLKELFLVPRPFMREAIAPMAGLNSFSSLPSTHAAVAFALATTVAINNKKTGIVAFLLAALVSLGRVAARVHYPLDIAVGMLIGVLCGMFFDTIVFSKRKKK